jgi:hypothetical protein
MGSDPAPFFANLFLSHYESQWIKTICRDDYVRARRLFNTSRFIDDLLTLNDNGEFNNSHREIYPQELVLNQENTVNTSATFLDLNIEVKGNIFEYKLFDKRNDFPFYIIRFPYKSSTIPKKMFFSTIQAELLRICRATSRFQSYLASCKPFLERMVKQGCTKSELKFPIKQIITNHFTDFNKFGLLLNHLIYEITNLL